MPEGNLHDAGVGVLEKARREGVPEHVRIDRASEDLDAQVARNALEVAGVEPPTGFLGDEKGAPELVAGPGGEDFVDVVEKVDAECGVYGDFAGSSALGDFGRDDDVRAESVVGINVGEVEADDLGTAEAGEEGNLDHDEVAEIARAGVAQKTGGFIVGQNLDPLVGFPEGGKTSLQELRHEALLLTRITADENADNRR